MKPPDKATDLAADMRSTGLNHIAFDVGPAIEAEGLDGLRGFLSQLNREVLSQYATAKSCRVIKTKRLACVQLEEWPQDTGRALI